jgi:hypothetical protein
MTYSNDRSRARAAMQGRSGRTLLVAAMLCAAAAGAAPAQQSSLPDRLSDAEFWKIVTDMSELGGVFPMENFNSNEGNIGAIAGELARRGPHGGVYLGVGPEQNLTYIAAMRPQVAFIVDIRRQAVMQHLMYKAIFEMSRDRADFLSLLLAIPRPAGLTPTTPLEAIWTALIAAPADPSAPAANRQRITERLTRTHGFTFTAEEQRMLEHVYAVFARMAVNGRGAAARGGRGGWTVTGPVVSAATAPAPINFLNLTLVRNAAGELNSFLASDDGFQFLKQLNERNLYIPVSGDFAGPKTMRAVGAWVKARGATIRAFYVSSVEVFLFENGVARAFYDNVATFPIDATSVFIRPTAIFDGNPQRDGTPIYTAHPTGEIGQSLCPIAPFMAAVAQRGITPGGRGSASSFKGVMDCRP